MDTRTMTAIVLAVLIVIGGIVIVNDRNRHSEEKMTEMGYEQVPQFEGSSNWTWRKFN